jgi:hypothetical protein
MWPFSKKKRVKEQQVEKTEEKTVRAQSFLEPELVAKIGGLPSEAIYGFMEGEDGYSLEQFQPNPVFIRFMHEVISDYYPNNPPVQEHVRNQEKGSFSIIDLRTPEGPQGRVPMEDIIGIFEIKNGQITKESYWANEKHLLLSENGSFQLPPDLHRHLLETIIRKATKDT